MDHLRNKWALKSLTIGPQFDKTDIVFWEEAFEDLPPLLDVDNVTIIHHYFGAAAFNIDFWKYFDHVLTRRDLFPALKTVYVWSDCAPLSRQVIYNSMPTVMMKRLGPRKFLAFGQDYRTNAPYQT